MTYYYISENDSLRPGWHQVEAASAEAAIRQHCEARHREAPDHWMRYGSELISAHDGADRNLRTQDRLIACVTASDGMLHYEWQAWPVGSGRI